METKKLEDLVNELENFRNKYRKGLTSAENSAIVKTLLVIDIMKELESVEIVY